MNVLSLFSGIGGLELGLERAGMTVVGQVEINPFCCTVLEKHWPGVPRHDDVRTAVDWWTSEARPHVDLICGGFPCQDISNATTRIKRDGLDGTKSGLWSSFRTVVSTIRPAWVVVENSPRWSTWMPSVREQLSADGYESVGLILSAGTFGAPHRRPRGVVVANSDGNSESLCTIYAEVVGLQAFPRRGRPAHNSGAVGVGNGIPNRMDRLAALGNAVVPQVSQFIGEQLMAQLASEVA